MPKLVAAYHGQDWRSFLAMPGPLLDAHINREPMIRAQFMLDVAEAVTMGSGASTQGGLGAYLSWRNRLEQFVQGDAIRSDGHAESFLSIRARREAGRAERERQRRERAEA